MKASVDRAALAAALASCSRVIAKRETVPAVMHVVVVAEDGPDGGCLTLTATDLDMEVTFRVPAEVATPGSTSMLADVFAGFVGRAATSVVTMQTTPDGRVVVKAGRSQVTVPTHNVEGFPYLFASELTPAFEIAGEAMGSAFKRCLMAAAVGGGSRDYLCGVYLQVPSGSTKGGDDARTEIAFAGANGNILMEVLCEVEGDIAFAPFILPSKAAAEVDRLARGAVAVSVSSRVVRFAFEGGATLTTKTIEGSYPDYRRMVPGAAEPCVVDREMLSAALDRVAIADDGRDQYARFDMRDGLIVIDRETGTKGAVYDEVACVGGHRVMWAAGHDKVSTALRAIGGERVEIVAGRKVDGTMVGAGDMRPVAFRPEGKTDAVFVLAPMLPKSLEPAVARGDG